MKQIIFILITIFVFVLQNNLYSQSERWVEMKVTNEYELYFDKETLTESETISNHNFGVWIKYIPKTSTELNQVLYRFVIKCKRMEIIESMREEYYKDETSKTITSGEKFYIIPDTYSEYIYNYFCK